MEALHPPPARAPCARALLLKAAVALAMLAGLLLARNLWLPTRTYPLAPVADALPALPDAVQQLGFVALLALLALVVVLPWPRLPLALFVTTAGLLSLWDQSRWQPWFYQYLFLLFALCFYPWGDPDAPDERRQRVLNACRLVVAGTYFWSGLQKFNVSFATDVFPWLVEPLVPSALRDLARTGALLVPVLETAIGAGLLVPGYRRLAVLLALGMHAVILYCLGPLGHNWNTVVWPWNVAMMAFVLTLFWRVPEIGPRELLWPGRSIVQGAALLLFGVLPVLNFFDRWDAYLSAALYSGNTVRAEIVLPTGTRDALPPELRKHCPAGFDGACRVDLFDWSIEELNVPAYPAERVYRRIARQLAAHAPDPAAARLILRGPPHWLTGVRPQRYYAGPNFDREVPADFDWLDDAP